MRNQKKKTILKTIRITEDMNRLLEKDAKFKRISVNALVSTIMTKYAEWDRYMDRTGSITMKPQALIEILDKVEDDKLEDIARRNGSRFPREAVLFWFKKETLETFLESLMLICRYKGYAHYELEREGSNYTIVLVHELGLKWSNFLRCIVEEGMKSTVGIFPKVRVNQDSVMVNFNSTL